MRLAREAFQQRGGEPRLPNAGLAGEEQHLAFAGLGSRPAPRQQFEFFFPPDEGCQASRVQCLEAAGYRAWPQRGPRPHWLDDALDFPFPEVIQIEQIAEKLSRAFGDDEGIWLGDAL
jgi:hypothetical protein